jgi:hypothetical protein
VECAEKRCSSQVARDYELALPASMSAQQREAIVRAFARELVLRNGDAVTTAIHEPSRYGDDRNFRAHILSTTRRMEADGLGKKTRILDDIKTGPQEVLYLRQYACELINDALERAGVDERVDHRSFEERGLDREATEHLGSTASEMERNGQASEKGDRNREIEEANRERDKLVEELAAIDAEIAAEEERLLDERYGDADDLEPDSPVPDQDSTDSEGAPPEERKRSYDESMTEYAEQLAEAMRVREASEPRTAFELQDAHPSEAGSMPDPRTWWQKAEDYAAGYARDMREHGEIAWRDGLTWRERTAQVFRDWSRGSRRSRHRSPLSSWPLRRHPASARRPRRPARPQPSAALRRLFRRDAPASARRSRKSRPGSQCLCR